MRVIELVWDADCPNVDAARRNLAEALRRTGGAERWTEWRRDDVRAPSYAREAGSPAVLIDGRDVEGILTGAHACCRVYVGRDGARTPAPSVEQLVDALERASASGGSGSST